MAKMVQTATKVWKGRHSDLRVYLRNEQKKVRNNLEETLETIRFDVNGFKAGSLMAA